MKNITEPITVLYEEKFNIEIGNITYELKMKCCNDCISFIVKRNLPYSIYEGNYSFEELNNKHFFKNYDDITSIYNKLVSKIRNKSLTLKLDNGIMTISTVYMVDEEVKTANLSLVKHENIDQSVEVDGLCKTVLSLEDKVNNLLQEKNEIAKLKDELLNLKSSYNQSQQESAKYKIEVINLKESLSKCNQEIILLRDILKSNFTELKDEIVKNKQDHLVERNNLNNSIQKVSETAVNKLKNNLEIEVNVLKQDLIIKNNYIDLINKRLSTLEEQHNNVKRNETLREHEKVYRINKENNTLEDELRKLKANKEKEDDYKKLSSNPSCLIKSIEEYNKLKEWIIMSNNYFYTKIKLTLLYDSLINTDSCKEFHLKCDNQGATISIIESEYGLRFGGYTTLSWESSSEGKWKGNDYTAFIFSLSKMKKFNCTNQSKVIYCNKNCNLVYGDGSDIFIENNFTCASDNYSYLGYSYDATGINESNKYLAGAHKFKVNKIEVYRVELQ